MYANQQNMQHRPSNGQKTHRLLEAIDAARSQAELLIQEASHFKHARDEVEHKRKLFSTEFS
jgi:hypothetical protein